MTYWIWIIYGFCVLFGFAIYLLMKWPPSLEPPLRRQMLNPKLIWKVIRYKYDPLDRFTTRE